MNDIPQIASGHQEPNNSPIVTLTPALSLAMKNCTGVRQFLSKELKFVSSFCDVSEPDQYMFGARLLLCQYISYIEGTCYQFKRIIFAVDEEVLANVFTENELLKLQDKKRKSRTDKIKTFYLPTRDLVKFVFASFAKLFAQEFKLDLGGGWRDFLAALDIRNRITHPKHHDGLFISSAEFERVSNADKWFAMESSRLVKHFMQSLNIEDQECSN